MANKQPKRPAGSYTGRDLILHALNPLRRAHLEGKLEGLIEAGRIAAANPDYSGRLLSSKLQEKHAEILERLMQEAKASEGDK
jgi:hypothetical protein